MAITAAAAAVAAAAAAGDLHEASSNIQKPPIVIGVERLNITNKTQKQGLGFRVWGLGFGGCRDRRQQETAGDSKRRQ